MRARRGGRADRHVGPEELAALLERRFRTAVSEIEVGGVTVSLLHPANAEELIDEEEFAIDERLPYWADVWPSSRALAADVLAMRGAGRSLLELGSGLGLVTTCAILAGFQVTATDYYDDALLFARVNAWRNGVAPPRTATIDWRRLPKELARADVVVASDVLYEREYGALVAGAIDATLGRDGMAVVADPGRLGAETFERQAAAVGLQEVGRDVVPIQDGPRRHSITLFRLGRVGERTGRM